MYTNFDKKWSPFDMTTPIIFSRTYSANASKCFACSVSKSFQWQCLGLQTLPYKTYHKTILKVLETTMFSKNLDDRDDKHCPTNVFINWWSAKPFCSFSFSVLHGFSRKFKCFCHSRASLWPGRCSKSWYSCILHASHFSLISFWFVTHAVVIFWVQPNTLHYRLECIL